MKNFKNKLLYIFQFVLFSINYIKPNNFDEARFYKENISGEAIIFDVGANLGTYTSFVARTLKNINLNIYAFEPNKQLTSGYSKIKILNGRLNIENIGISNQEGKATFYERNISSYSSLSEKNLSDFHKIINKYEVNTQGIDTYCNENKIDFIDLLKIDTESNDLNVLYSAKSMLENKKINLIKVETVFDSQDYIKILTYLTNLDYLLIGINNIKYINNKIMLSDCFFKIK
mgnify:CR=1 FL=1